MSAPIPTRAIIEGSYNAFMAKNAEVRASGSKKEDPILDISEKRITSYCQELLKILDPTEQDQKELAPGTRLRVEILNSKLNQEIEFYSSIAKKSLESIR